jgi:hypothetical protein
MLITRTDKTLPWTQPIIFLLFQFYFVSYTTVFQINTINFDRLQVDVCLSSQKPANL